MHASLLRSIFFVSLASTAVAAQGNVLIVGPGGFNQIQDAVEAAADGDTILLKNQSAGAHLQAVDIAGKELTIVTDTSSAIPIVRGLSVHDLPEGKTVVLSRLRVQSPFFSFTSPVLLQNNAGSVRLVNCNVTSTPFYYFPPTSTTITSSTGTTAMASCALLGGDGGYKVDGFNGARGLRLENARMAAFDSTIAGGDGGYSYIGFCGDGGAGATVTAAGLPTKLLLSNSTVQGGLGGESRSCFYSFPSGDGAPGLVVGPGATVAHQQCTIAGGMGGPSPCMLNGADAPPIDNSGVVQSIPTAALELTAPTVAREGEAVTFTLRGVPGDQVVLFTGNHTTWRERPDGVLLVQPGGFALFPRRGPIGTIGPSGVLDVDISMTLLPPGVESANLWVQALARHPDGKRTLGSFCVITVLDSAF